MKFAVVIILLSLFYGCGQSSSNLPVNKYGESIDLHVDMIRFLPENEMLELKSYSATCAWSIDSIDRVLGYNRYTHALDVLEIGGECKMSSIYLEREGPDGIPGRICSIYAVNQDSIWVYDETRIYLLNGYGQVKYKAELPRRESIEVRSNYAMNTSKFIYNKEHHSLLYLAYRDDTWVVEEFQINMNKVINTYPLSFSLCNSSDKGFYGNKKAPNLNFGTNGIIYNYPYESTAYLLDTITGSVNAYGGRSQYTKNIAEECQSVNDYSAWERHFVENPHFYEVSYLPELDMYVRLHLGEKSYSTDLSLQEMIDGKTLYAMFFDKNFNVIGEFDLQKNRYSYFTGWCVLPSSVLLFVENSLSDGLDSEELMVDLLFPKSID